MRDERRALRSSEVAGAASLVVVGRGGGFVVVVEEEEEALFRPDELLDSLVEVGKAKGAGSGGG